MFSTSPVVVKFGTFPENRGTSSSCIPNVTWDQHYCRMYMLVKYPIKENFCYQFCPRETCQYWQQSIEVLGVLLTRSKIVVCPMIGWLSSLPLAASLFFQVSKKGVRKVRWGAPGHLARP
jgi:hypothetical protein